MEEYVFLLNSNNKLFLGASRTQTVWASSQEEAFQKIQSWKHFGYEPEYLYTISDFKKKCAKNEEFERKLNELHSKTKNVHIEVENV